MRTNFFLAALLALSVAAAHAADAEQAGLRVTLAKGWQQQARTEEVLDLRHENGSASVLIRKVPRAGVDSPLAWLKAYVARVKEKEGAGQVFEEAATQRVGAKDLSTAVVGKRGDDGMVFQRLYVLRSKSKDEYLVAVCTAPADKSAAHTAEFEEMVGSVQEN